MCRRGVEAGFDPLGWVSFVGRGNLEFVLRLIEIWIVWAKKEVVAVVLVFKISCVCDCFDNPCVTNARLQNYKIITILQTRLMNR